MIENTLIWLAGKNRFIITTDLMILFRMQTLRRYSIASVMFVYQHAIFWQAMISVAVDILVSVGMASEGALLSLRTM